MASGETLDLHRLTTPISADHPVGEDDFRSADSAAYFELRKLRDELKKEEDKGLFGDSDGDDGPDGDWEELLLKSSDALAMKTKDIQLVCWMLESLPRVHGFAGLRDGLRLLIRLVEQFFQELFPRPDEEGVHEDDIYTCVEPFDRLDNGPLPDAVSRIVVTQGSPPGPFTFWHYEQAMDLSQRTSDIQEERRQDGWVTLNMFEQAIRETPDSFFRNIYEDLAACEESLNELDALLEEKCGDQDGAPLNPSVRNLRSRLEEAGRQLRTFAGAALEQLPEKTSSEGEGTDVGIAAATANSIPASSRTRDSAFRELEDIAEFFRKTEPHSVLSYMLHQVVRYGRMSLPELLQDLLRDEDERRNLFRHVGIETRKEDE